jgi:hypothetical protein
MEKALDREAGHIPMSMDIEQQFTDLFGNNLETGRYPEMWWACYAPLLPTSGLCMVTRK